MTKPDNIEFFDRFTLALLERLYAEFPTPAEVDVKGIAASLLPDDVDSEVGFRRLSSADDTVDFLTTEGFLTHAGAMLSGGTFLQMRLTAKGLAILNSVPSSLENKRSLITQIRELAIGGLKAAATETVKQLAHQVVSSAVTLAQ